MPELGPKRRSATILTVHEEEGCTAMIHVISVDVSGVQLDTDYTDVMNEVIQTQYKNKSLTVEFVTLLHKIKTHVEVILDLIVTMIREK